MKILITNIVVLNTGDAAILQGKILLLRQLFGPDVCIQIHGAQWEVAQEHYPELKFHPELYRQVFKKSTSPFWERVCARLERTQERPAVLRFYAGAWLYGRGQRLLAKVVLPKGHFEALEDYDSADLIISSGGTYLVENYNLEAKIVHLMTAVLLRKPLILYTQSLGPFANMKYRKRLRIIFRNALAVLLRDERSQRHVRELEVSCDNLHVTADAAFALADPQKWRDAARANPHLKIAVSVREWPHFKQLPAVEGQARYVRAMRELITHLVRAHRAEVLLLSTCKGIPEYWTDDSRLARELRQGLPADVAEHAAVDCSFHSPAELIDILGGFDLVISTRMHMAILALAAGTPVLAVAYEFKTLELFRELGHAELAHDIETITPEAIMRSADEALGNLPALQDSFRKATLRQKERVYESAQRVKDVYQEYIQGQKRRD